MIFSLLCDEEFGVETESLPFFLMKPPSTALWGLV